MEQEMKEQKINDLISQIFLLTSYSQEAWRFHPENVDGEDPKEVYDLYQSHIKRIESEIERLKA